MARINSGITSKPRGSTGTDTFQRVRNRHGDRTLVRGKPHPTNPKTTLQERNRDRFAVAQGLAGLAGRELWSGAWATGKRSGYQVLTSWLSAQLLYQPTSNWWYLRPDIQPVHLGPGHAPFTTNLLSSGAVSWSTESTGDHSASTDTVRGFVLPREPERVLVKPPFGEHITGKTRADGLWVPSTYPATLTAGTYVVLWIEHRNGSRVYWSPAVSARYG